MCYRPTRYHLHYLDISFCLNRNALAMLVPPRSSTVVSEAPSCGVGGAELVSLGRPKYEGENLSIVSRSLLLFSLTSADLKRSGKDRNMRLLYAVVSLCLTKYDLAASETDQKPTESHLQRSFATENPPIWHRVASMDNGRSM